MTYLSEIDGHALLTSEEEVDLFQRVEAGDETAKQALVTSNLRLVVWVARRYQRSGVPLADLVQEGTLGLMRAIEGFDWRRGFKFSTYATWWIRQGVLRAVRETSQTIRIPESVTEQERGLRRTVEELTARLGRAPNEAEILDATELDPRALHRLQRSQRVVVSLDSPVDGEGASLGDLVAVDDGTQRELEVEMRADAVRRLIGVVPERVRIVLELRFGLSGEEPQTLGQVGERLGLSPERVRQIEQRALHDLARRAERADLRHAS